MLLGSEWSVYWAKVAQQVAAEQAVVNAAHTAGVPVYGICFGAQMIAAALGGSVARAHVPEIGWYDNIVSELPNVIPPGPWMQWHSDIVTLPPGAQELARSPLATQAFRIRRTFATQFHPEVTEAMVTRWALSPNAEAELQRVGLTAEELRTLTSQNVIASRPNAERIVDWFLDEVAGT